MGFIADLFGYLLNALYTLFNNYRMGNDCVYSHSQNYFITNPVKTATNSKMQEEMKQLQFRYKNNPEQLNQEMMAMYKRYGTSPFSGCLSGILQILIVISVFILVSQPLTHMKKLTEKYDENAEDESIRNKTSIMQIKYKKKMREEPLIVKLELLTNMEQRTKELI